MTVLSRQLCLGSAPVRHPVAEALPALHQAHALRSASAGAVHAGKRNSASMVTRAAVVDQVGFLVQWGGKAVTFTELYL